MESPQRLTYPPPSGAKLSEAQRKPFAAIVSAIVATNFDRSAIDKLMPGFIELMKSICSTADDQDRIVEELDDWVRWHPLSSYYLTFVFQETMQALGSLRIISAGLLFAAAQDHFAEDLSLHSLETAYTNWKKYSDAAGSTGAAADAINAIAAIGAQLRDRLLATYGYYRQWYSSESYTNINPLSESLYFERPWNDLKQAFPDLNLSRRGLDPATLQDVIHRCAAPEQVYCRVVAGRHLGIVYAAATNYRAAAEAYEAALSDALAVRLDAEIGHLHRLRGWALMMEGRLDDAELEHRKALSHDARPKYSYWKALTFGELGDVRMRRLGPELDPAHPPAAWAEVAQAYAEGRSSFETDMFKSVFPVTRAVKQQMMRSYADNAIQIAALEPQEMLAAIETFGPRYANDIVAEGRAAAALDTASYARFREARAIVQSNLATMSTNSDPETVLGEYAGDVVANFAGVRYYIQTRQAMSAQIVQAQKSAEVVERALALRIPNTALLLFNVERTQTHVVLADASSGTVLPPESVPLAEAEWKENHAAYEAEAQQASQPRTDPAPAMRKALDALLEFYQAPFGGLFEQWAPALEGNHLKIFPRFLMNRVPLHALRAGGKYLIDVCDVSYAPSLSIFLQVHEPSAAPPAGTLTILHDAARTPAYAGTMRALAALPAGAPTVVPGPTWQNFRESLSSHPASDILFACHGKFDGDVPSKSRVEVTRNEPVDFATLFADLDLRGYRSVTLGACESGIGRTLVAAEYIGLPMAFLAAGVRYVIGTLWEVTQLSAAILVATHYTLLSGGTRPVVNCLNEAARRLKSMSKDDVMAWVGQFLPEQTKAVTDYLKKLEDPPFGHPYYWAGFYISGDT